MASEGRDAIATFSGNIVRSILVLGTQSCLAWLLGPAGRGEYAAILVFSSLLTLIFGLGVEMGLIHHMGSKKLKLSDAVAAGLVWCIISSIPAFGIGSLLINLPLSFFEKADSYAFFISLFLIPLNLVALVYTRALIALGRFVTFNCLTAARYMVVLLATILILSFTNLRVYGTLVALIIGDLLLALIIHFHLHRTHGLKMQFPSWQAMRLLASFSTRFYIGKVGNGFNFLLGTLLVGFLGTKTDVGLFATAIALVARVWMVPDTANLVLLPRTATRESGQPEMVAFSCRVSAIILVIVVGLLLIFVRPLVIIFFSREFLPVVSLIWILAFGIIIRGHQRVLASYFNGLGRPEFYSIGIVIGLFVNLIFMPLLYKWIKLEGAALSMTLSYTVETLVVAYFFIRVSNQPVDSLWRLKWSDFSIFKVLYDKIR